MVQVLVVRVDIGVVIYEAITPQCGILKKPEFDQTKVCHFEPIEKLASGISHKVGWSPKENKSIDKKVKQ